MEQGIQLKYTVFRNIDALSVKNARYTGGLYTGLCSEQAGYLNVNNLNQSTNQTKPRFFRIKYKFLQVFYLEMGRVSKQECGSLELQEWRINVIDIETYRLVSRKLKDWLSLYKIEWFGYILQWV
jgi:hypothetical protein